MKRAQKQEIAKKDKEIANVKARLVLLEGGDGGVVVKQEPEA